MKENCEIIREEFALDPLDPMRSERVSEHVASCPDCARFLARLEGLEKDLASLSSSDVSDETVQKLLARPELTQRSRSPHFWRWSMGLAAAASVLLVLFVTRSAYEPSAPVPAEFEAQGELLRDERKNAPKREIALESEVDAQLKTKELRESNAGVPADRVGRLDDKAQTESLDAPAARLPGKARQKKDSAVEADEGVASGVIGDELFFGVRAPEKRVHRDPVYPEAAQRARVEGTVVLEVTVDREGNVIDVRVVTSVPLLDQAAIDAVREWKYAASESDETRRFVVSVPFVLEPRDKDARLFDERRAIEGLRFREAHGYWANTYVPGDPKLRRLEARLRKAGVEIFSGQAPVLHQIARPVERPFDPSSRAALSLSVRSDRRGVAEKSRVLVQVGIRAASHFGRRRPPMNVAIVLDLSQTLGADERASAKSLLESLERSRELGDRFRLVVAGPSGSEVLSPETFRHGALAVALRDLFEPAPTSSSLPLRDAFALALEQVLAGDDPTTLGTSLVLLITAGRIESNLESVARLASHGALAGVSVSAVGLGAGADETELEHVALSGHGRRYVVERASGAPGVVDRELSASSRAVARAVRLRIELAEGVRLVDVLGSKPLSESARERVRAEEKSIDARVAKTLGIEADRGEDESGIQILIPTFYAGDAHSILLDVVADGPGEVASVTARYKDLVELKNTVARASLALVRSEEAPGPLQESVVDDYVAFRLSEELGASAEALDRGDVESAKARLHWIRGALAGRGLGADVQLVDNYLGWLPRISSPAERSYLRDSLLYASTLKRLPSLPSPAVS